MATLCVDTKQAAAALGISVWVVRRYIADGVLPTVKLPSVKHAGESSRRVLIAVADLEALVARFREARLP